MNSSANSAQIFPLTEILWARRTNISQYEGHNGRHASVLIGLGEGAFSPIELLKLALATCNSISADKVLAQVLGADFKATVDISAHSTDDHDRIDSFEVELVTDLSPLNIAETKTLVTDAQTAIDAHCPVGHTLNHTATYHTTFISEPSE